MKRWVGACVALGLAGFTGAWICLRLLLLPLLLVGIVGLGGCVPVLAGGIAGGVAGASLGAAVARGVASAVPVPNAGPPLVPQKPEPGEWRDLDAADAAARKAVTP